MDKSKELNASINLINDKLNFRADVDGNQPISVDYIPPFGDNLGYTSLELLLISLSSCAGSALLIFLRKMGKVITEFGIDSKGIRNTEHPTGFKSITLNMKFTSDNLTNEDVDKVLKLTEDTYCPVWSMLKGNVEILTEYQITQ